MGMWRLEHTECLLPTHRRDVDGGANQDASTKHESTTRAAVPFITSPSSHGLTSSPGVGGDAFISTRRRGSVAELQCSVAEQMNTRRSLFRGGNSTWTWCGRKRLLQHLGRFVLTTPHPVTSRLTKHAASPPNSYSHTYLFRSVELCSGASAQTSFIRTEHAFHAQSHPQSEAPRHQQARLRLRHRRRWVPTLRAVNAWADARYRCCRRCWWRPFSGARVGPWCSAGAGMPRSPNEAATGDPAASPSLVNPPLTLPNPSASATSPLASAVPPNPTRPEPFPVLQPSLSSSHIGPPLEERYATQVEALRTMAFMKAAQNVRVFLAAGRDIQAAVEYGLGWVVCRLVMVGDGLAVLSLTILRH